jgi:hypothetical protein
MLPWGAKSSTRFGLQRITSLVPKQVSDLDSTSALRFASSAARGLVDPPVVVTILPKHPLSFGDGCA